MLDSIRIVGLHQNERAIVVFSEAYQLVPASAFRAHEAKAERIHVRFNVNSFEFSSATDAFPHGGTLFLAGGMLPPPEQRSGVGPNELFAVMARLGEQKCKWT